MKHPEIILGFIPACLHNFLQSTALSDIINTMWKRTLTLSLIIIFAIVFGGWFGTWHREMQSGNVAYRLGNYDAAMNAFQQAVRQKPDNPLAHYNLGTALYKQGQFKMAAAAFQASLLTGEPRAATYYNLGNAQFQSGELDKAIEAYRNALQLTPTDADAKHNLELALQQRQNQPKVGGQQKTERQERPNPSVSESETRRLLAQLREKENSIRRKSLQRQFKSGYRREKDW